jgi:hypothetical protein
MTIAIASVCPPVALLSTAAQLSNKDLNAKDEKVIEEAYRQASKIIVGNVEYRPDNYARSKQTWLTAIYNEDVNFLYADGSSLEVIPGFTSGIYDGDRTLAGLLIRSLGLSLRILCEYKTTTEELFFPDHDDPRPVFEAAQHAMKRLMKELRTKPKEFELSLNSDAQTGKIITNLQAINETKEIV